MRKNTMRSITIVISAALIAVRPAAASAASLGTNLIANGNAEANNITDFTASPGFQTLSYTYGGSPVAGDPGVSERGNYFFYAGEPASPPPRN